MRTKRIHLKLFLVFALALLWSGANPVSAHVLITDGSMGAVLHIEPEDDPIIDEPATFHFDFKDTQGPFDLEHCLCTFRIIQNENVLYEAPLFGSAVSFAFPEKSIYTVEVIGKPSSADDFAPFDLRYDLRVEREMPKTEQTRSLPTETDHLMLYGSGILIAMILYALNRFYKRPQKI